MQFVEPHQLIPGSQIRAVRLSGVKKITDSIAKEGWSVSTIITNKTSKEGVFRVIDGMHRVEAAKWCLVHMPEVFKPGWKIQISVYKPFLRHEEIAIANSILK